VNKGGQLQTSFLGPGIHVPAVTTVCRQGIRNVAAKNITHLLPLTILNWHDSKGNTHFLDDELGKMFYVMFK